MCTVKPGYTYHLGMLLKIPMPKIQLRTSEEQDPGISVMAPNTPIPVKGTPARNLLLCPDALLPAAGNPSPGGGDKEGSPKQNPPPASRKLLMLSKLILLLLAKFFERKKANKKTHSSKGTQLIFFSPT